MKAFDHFHKSFQKILDEFSVKKPHKNFAFIFLPPTDSNLSIKCKLEIYKPKGSCSIEDLNNTEPLEEVIDKDDNDYFGLHPKITGFKIKELIMSKDSIFSSENKLQKYCWMNADKWSVHNSLKYDDYTLRAIYFEKTLLCMSFFYYIQVVVSKEVYSKLIPVLVLEDRVIEEQLHFSFYDVLSDDLNNQIVINLYGRLPDRMLKKLDSLGCKVKKPAYDRDDRFEIIISDSLVGADVVNICDIYLPQYMNSLKCVDDFFYSGVNLKAEWIEYKDNYEYGQSYIFHVSKTTYATICGFDGFIRGRKDKNKHYNIMGHPYLALYQADLVAINEKERKLLKTFQKSIEELRFADENNYSQKTLDLLNGYLKDSAFPHHVNVSGNIFTNEDICIYTKRGSGMVDPGTLYCSVNGVAEINDIYVDLYRITSIENNPTINFSYDCYDDFEGELSREAEAELGISSFNSKWKYYGFSLMGYLKNSIVESSHFNILSYNNANLSFDQIIKSWQTASEKNENTKIFGYKIDVDINLQQTFSRLFSLIIGTIIAWKEIIIIFAILLYQFISFNEPISTAIGYLYFLGRFDSFIGAIQFIINSALILSFLIAINNKRKLLTRINRLRVKYYCRFDYLNALQNLYAKKLFKKGDFEYAHIIAVIMGGLNIRNRINQRLRQ